MAANVVLQGRSLRECSWDQESIGLCAAALGNFAARV